jgi:NAD(P)H-hydrate epimerase
MQPLNSLKAYATYLKPRPRDWHKGLSGHVLIVGGESGYSGAPCMAGVAALRVGAGMVSVATRPEHANVLNSYHPEIMCHGVTKPDELDPLIKKARVIILGPGLGQTDWSKKMFEQVCKASLPLVIDADGLNLLADTKQFNKNWVLTPHPGEAARLLQTTPQAIQQDRLAALKEINQRYGGVSVLKGAGTLVMSAEDLPVICEKGNPGMATAGMGDVLSGVIGGWIAQGVPLADAAKLGVCMHAMAGDLAAKEGERGMMATDLMPYLRRLSNNMSADK